MKTKLFVLISVIIIFGLSLSGCQSSVETTLPLPTEVPSTKTSMPPTTTPAPSDTPEPAPTETPVLPTPTSTAQPEQRVESIDELIGVWKGFWSNINMVMLEFTANKQSTQSLTGGQFAGSEWYDFKDGLFTWGKMIKPMNADQDCIDNPAATYEVYIIYRGDEPEKLRFVLVGDDHCADRKDLLDGNYLSWVGTEAP